MALRSLLIAGGLAALAACTAIPADEADKAVTKGADRNIEAGNIEAGVEKPSMDKTQEQADAGSFTLAPGQQVALGDDGSLRYVRLVNDSRCAPDVRCVWAGDAIVAFEWKPASGAAQAFELHTGLEPRTHDIGNRKVRLTSLSRDPQPVATVQVDGGN